MESRLRPASNASTFKTQVVIGISFSLLMGGRAVVVRGMVLMGVGAEANGARTKAMKEVRRFLNLKKGAISSRFSIYM